MSEQLEDRLLDGMVYIPLEELTTPKQGRTCHVERWWVVHPEKGAAFYRNRRSPQCNDWEAYVQEWAKKFPNHECRKIDVAYV